MPSCKITYSIDETLDWKLLPGTSLRQTLIDMTERALEVEDMEGEIHVTIDHGCDNFVCVFHEFHVND